MVLVNKGYRRFLISFFIPKSWFRMDQRTVLFQKKMVLWLYPQLRIVSLPTLEELLRHIRGVLGKNEVFATNPRISFHAEWGYLKTRFNFYFEIIIVSGQSASEKKVCSRRGSNLCTFFCNCAAIPLSHVVKVKQKDI